MKSNLYDSNSVSGVQEALNSAFGVVYLNNTSYNADKVLNITGKNILINGSKDGSSGFSSFDGSNVKNSTLLNITGHSNVTLRNIVFKNFKNTAIKIDNSNVNFIDCSFMGNSVINGDGGAIYVNGGSVMFDYCNFTNNNAISSDKDIVNRFGLFDDDGEDPDIPQGGAICLNNVNSRFSHCNFKDNKAIDGGGLYIIHGSSNFVSCQFVNNVAEAIYKFNSNISIDGDVGVGVGGAIYIDAGDGIFDRFFSFFK